MFQHLQPRREDEVDDAGLDALERIGHHGQAEKTVKKERDDVDHHKGREADRSGGSRRPRRAADLIADVGGAVHGHGAGGGLGNGDHIQEFFSGHPLFFLDEFMFQQGHHSIAAAEGERADLQKGPKQGRNFFHTQFLIFSFSPYFSTLPRKRKAADRFSFQTEHGILSLVFCICRKDRKRRFAL